VKVFAAIVVTVIVLSGVGVAMFSGSLPGAGGLFNRETPATAVRMASVERRTLVESISAPGEIVPRTKVDISAQTMARIIALPFRDGDDVRAGDIVVRLDDRDLRASLDSASARRDAEMYRLQADQARLLSLQASLDLARRTLERQQALFASNDISRSALDEAVQRVDDLEAQLAASQHSISQTESGLAAAQAEIRRAEEAMRNTVIESPISGRITRLNAEVGEMVVTGTMNNPGTVIMTIADLDHMMMKARVAEADIADVAVGQTAKVHVIAYPDHVFEGVVRNIALQRSGAADGTGYFETEIDIKLDGMLLRSGLNANVDIQTASHEGIVVPSQAIVDRLLDDLPSDALTDDSIVDRTKLAARVVFRVIDGRAVAVPVRIGASDLTHTLVTAGLSEGDRIIIGPYKVLAEIKHDEPVRDMDSSPVEDSAGRATIAVGVSENEPS
jgi:HlyD family secretion protein